jgi:hypothetical protein
MDDIEQQVNELEQQFDQVIAKLTAGEPLTNEEGVSLFRVLGGLHSNLTISNEMLHTIHEEVPQMVRYLSSRIIQRCGRTDSKVKKSVEKLCAEHIDQLWVAVRLRALTVAETLRNTNTDSEPAGQQTSPIETNDNKGTEQ